MPEEFETLSYDEIVEALKFTKKPEGNDEKTLIKTKEAWVKDFLHLIDYVMVNDEKISSDFLTQLWFFYNEGVRIRNLFQSFSKEELQYVEDINNPFVRIIEDDISTINKNGTFIYQVCYYLDTMKKKMKNNRDRYEKIYKHSSDPIEWYKANNNSAELKFTADVKVIDLLDKLVFVDKPHLDPVRQK